LSATSSLDKIEYWTEHYPDRPWAVATGFPSGVFAVQVSRDRGRAIIRANSGDDSSLDGTLQLHSDSHVVLFFRWPHDGFPARRRELLAEGVYIRQAGGYVALPSGSRDSGDRYVFNDRNAMISDAPGRLMEFITSKLGEYITADLISFGSRGNATFRVRMAFTFRGGNWICVFYATDGGGAIIKTLSFRSPKAIFKLAERGGIPMDPTNWGSIERSIERGRGNILLTLTRGQYAKLLAA
jgi:hypothetical protein